MIRIILYSCLFIFTSPVVALELTQSANSLEFNFSDQQCQTLKDGIFCEKPELLSPAWESTLEALFPELPTELDSQPQAGLNPGRRNTYRSCPLCGKLVSKISAHLRYHKDEYSYFCDQCPQMFKEACNLSRHKKQHEAKRARESETLLGLSATLVDNLNKVASGTTLQKDKKRKTAVDKDQEEIQDLNTEFKAPEYTSTKSAKPILSKLSLMGEPVSGASMERLARSLEDMAQKTPGGAKILRNHIRLESKIKKYTPTGPSTKAQSSAANKKQVNYLQFDTSNHKKFSCPHCSATYKRESFLEKHSSQCISQPKEIAAAIALSAIHYLADDQTVAPLNPADLRPQLNHTLQTESPELQKREKKFKCTLCARKYDRISRLNLHLKNSHRAPETGDIVCAICNKGFKLKRSFENHMNLHTGNRPHSCKSCQKNFQTRSQLQHHTRTNCPERS